MDAETPDTEIRQSEDFFSNIMREAKSKDDARKEIDLYLARDFNFFDYYDVWENKLSDIIRGLLDPNGSHGQGITFLSHFLETCEILKDLGNTDLHKCQIRREEITEKGRRMDITVHGQNWAVCIELKINAPELKDQLSDYYEHLKNTCNKDHKIYMVFLTKNGDESESYPPAIRMSYIKENSTNHCLTDWLDKCIKDCRAEKVNVFLKMFQEKIRSYKERKIMTSYENEIKNIIYKYAFSSQENFNCILKNSELIGSIIKEFNCSIYCSVFTKIIDSVFDRLKQTNCKNLIENTKEKRQVFGPDEGYTSKNCRYILNEVLLGKQDNRTFYIGIGFLGLINEEYKIRYDVRVYEEDSKNEKWCENQDIFSNYIYPMRDCLKKQGLETKINLVGRELYTVPLSAEHIHLDSTETVTKLAQALKIQIGSTQLPMEGDSTFSDKLIAEISDNVEKVLPIIEAAWSTITQNNASTKG